jgi:uncharacterized protein YneF (UPF0154 family)
MNRRLTEYISKFALLLIYLFLYEKKMLLPDSCVIWVWVVYIVNLLLVHFCSGRFNTAEKITKIYLNNKPDVNGRKERKMALVLLPDSMVYLIIIWAFLRLLSFLWILFYQGLVLGICSEILLFILLTILPVQYKSHLRYIYRHFGGPDSKQSKDIAEAGFHLEDIKSVTRKAIDENINHHKWWMEMKK